jgi:hypothetical protein
LKDRGLGVFHPLGAIYMTLKSMRPEATRRLGTKFLREKVVQMLTNKILVEGQRSFASNFEKELIFPHTDVLPLLGDMTSLCEDMCLIIDGLVNGCQSDMLIEIFREVS